MTRNIFFKWMIAFASLATLFLCLASSVSADSKSNWLTDGFAKMCERIPAECEPYKEDEPAIVMLDQKKALQLVEINMTVNNEYAHKTDKEIYGIPDYWTYPTDAADCEDFVLEKRRRLVELGWPRRAMLIVVVTLDDNPKEGHAVLVVMTDRGELTLDNMTDVIVPFEMRNFHRLVAIQSPRHPTEWILLDHSQK